MIMTRTSEQLRKDFHRNYCQRYPETNGYLIEGSHTTKKTATALDAISTARDWWLSGYQRYCRLSTWDSGLQQWIPKLIFTGNRCVQIPAHHL